MTKKVRFLLAFTMMVAFVTINTIQIAAAPQELTIWRGRLGAEWDEFQREVAKEFEAAHPNVKIVETVYPWDKLREKAFTVFQVGGEAPDIIFEGMNLIGSYAKADGLEPLDKYLKSWSETKTVPKNVWQAASYQNQIYGVPWGAIPYVTLYNKKMFAEAGVQPPKNWKEWRAIAEKLNNPSKNQYAWAVRTDRLLTSFFKELLWENGGGLFSNSMRGPGKPEDVALTSPKSVEALDELIKRASYAPGGLAGNVGLSGPDVVGLFATGKIAMLHGAIHQYGQVLTLNPKMEGNIGAFLNPGNRKKVTFVIGQTLVMTKKAKNKQLAWEYLKLSLSKKWETERCLRMGYAPFRMDITDPKVLGNPIISVGMEGVKQGIMQPDFPQWLEFRDVLKNDIQAVFLGQKSSKEALSSSAAQMKKVMSK